MRRDRLVLLHPAVSFLVEKNCQNSLIETAKLNIHEPYNYLRWLFNELPKVVDGMLNN